MLRTCYIRWAARLRW